MKPIAIAVLLTLCWVTTALCQMETATISGRVTDPSGAAISGADVQVQNVLTGREVAIKTNSSGLYVVPALEPGTYRVIVTNPGFKQIVKPDVTLNVQDSASINFGMTIGSVSETVTVEGGTPLVNTESAAVSTVIDRNFVANLPLNGRSFNTLLQLTPGVVIAPASYNSPGQFSVAGQRTDANNLTVDGVSANFGVAAGEGPSGGTGGAQALTALGGTSGLVSVEALQEFRIETSSFAPEFGKTPGGQVVLTTRTGTNELHGGIYEYFRNDALDASDWFNGQVVPALPKAAERHNDFGGFLGGPIQKDKTFFFFSYEGARLRLPKTETVEVPSEFSRESAPADVLPFLAAFPQPNDRTPISGVYTDPFTGTFSNKASLNAASLRVDETFNSRFSLFGRYSYAPSSITQRVYGLTDIETAHTNTQTLTVGLNMALSSAVVDTLRTNYSFQRSALTEALDSFNGATPITLNLFLGSASLPSVLGGFLALDANDYFLGPNSQNTARQMNIVNDLTVSRGTHMLKFGIDYRAIFSDFVPAQNNVDIAAISVQSFVTSQSALLLTSSSNPGRLLTQSLSLYGQDLWRISPRLTFTYGLRWELAPAPVGRDNTDLASWSNVNNPSQIALSPAGTPLWQSTYDKFAPRFGIAYSLGSKGDLVVRGAAGIFYDLGVGSSAQVAASFPNSVSAPISFVSLPISDIRPYLPTFSNAPPYPSPVVAFDPHLALPRSYEWNVAVEKSIARQQAVSVTYLGQAGRDLLRRQALYQPTPEFAGEFLLTGNTALSNYNSLQAQYRLRLSQLEMLLNYSWSHSLDNNSNDFAAGLSGTIVSAATDYASSDFDLRHSFSGALVWTSPSWGHSGIVSPLIRDWSLSGIVVARTGFPFNAIVQLPSLDPGGYAYSRPDLVPDQPVWISDPAVGGKKRLNPAAFLVPGTPRQGTEGRNDISGFGLTQLDFSIGRKFLLTERWTLQFRADAFNMLNHPNFTNPSGQLALGPTGLQSTQMLNQGLGGLNPLFQEGGPRSLQLSLKLTF